MSRGEICMMAFLGINTWTDIRKKEICFPVFCLFLVGGILWRITEGIGIFAAIISALTGGEIGAGDGLLIIAMGSVMTAGELIGILFAALLLCGIYSGIQLLVLKKQRDIEIPFVPFLLAGYLGGVFL